MEIVYILLEFREAATTPDFRQDWSTSTMDIFRVTQKMEVIEYSSETQERHIFFSRVEDVGQNSIFISPPYRKGIYLPLYIGRTINARVVSEQCAYLFEASLLGSHSDQLPLWEISLPTNIRRIQMRDHVRLDTVLDLTLELTGEAYEGKTIATLTKDISAGGLQAVVPEPLAPDIKVKVTLSLAPGITAEAEGEIIRVMLPDSPRDVFAAAIKFTQIDEKTRSQIIKYIFKKQTERRKKEQDLFQ